MTDTERIEPWERIQEALARSFALDNGISRPCIGRGCLSWVPSTSGSVLCRFCQRSAREAGSLLALFERVDGA